MESQTARQDHLGTLLDREFFLPRNLTIYRVAKDTGINPKLLCGTLTGRQILPVRDAITLARYFGVNEEFFAQKQLDYELKREQTLRREESVQILAEAA